METGSFLERDNPQVTLVAESTQILRQTDDIDAVIRFLRKRTGRKTASAQIVSEILEIPVHRAVLLVHNSKVWDDVRERDERFELGLVNYEEE